MSALPEKKCQVCEGGMPPLTNAQAEKLLEEIPFWERSKDNKFLMRSFSFKGFYQVMGFINALAYVVQKEGHHPDVEFGYNYCRVKFTTHAINGLSENDFICAAKINRLVDT
jgi:4a-hydroxytetrahydrobiopterin dehydratase